jgi:hypothetical protein
VRAPGKGGARFRAGRKVLSLVFAMLLGAQSIDGCDVLRSGRTSRLLGIRVMAPSTLGTFLRAFSFGHVRQLDRLLGLALGRAWHAGAGPGADRLVIDVDSFVGEVYGRLKQGASRGYTHVLGYHPLLATRADTGEVLQIRFRTGKANTQRGVIRFVDELVARVRAAGASGPILLRADSGFHTKGAARPAGRQGRAVLDRSATDQARRGCDQRDRRGRVADADGLPRHGTGADRRNHVGWGAPDRAPRAPAGKGRPRQAV